MSLTFGVVGVNHPHAGGHLQAFEAAPEIERLLIWDADPALAQGAVDNSAKATLAPSADALFADPALRVLAIFARDDEVAALNLRALEAGKWVYGDKPGGHNAAELAAQVEAAARSGVHFCPCYANRTSAREAGLPALLAGGAVGTPWSFSATWMTSSVALRGPEHWLFHREHSAGGILTWLACHWLDLLRHLFGCEVSEVMAMVSTRTEASVDVEDSASLILKFENGAVGNVRAGYSLNPFTGYEDSDLSVQIEGSLGSLIWLPRGPRAGVLLRSRHEGYADWTPPAPPEKARTGYAGDFLADFLAAVESGGEVPATEVDAWRVLQIVEAAYESSASGRRVSCGK